MLDVNAGSMKSSFALDQPIDDHLAEVRRAERAPAFDLLDVVARLHLGDDVGVRAGAADAALFELAHERPFVVPRPAAA